MRCAGPCNTSSKGVRGGAAGGEEGLWEDVSPSTAAITAALVIVTTPTITAVTDTIDPTVIPKRRTSFDTGVSLFSVSPSALVGTIIGNSSVCLNLMLVYFTGWV